MKTEKLNPVGILAKQRAAQAWCGLKTKHLEMNVDLAEEFAMILDSVWTQPWLGNATTKQLLDELYARSDLEYKTVGSE